MSFWEWLASAKGDVALAGVAGAAVSATLEWGGWNPFLRKMFVGSVTAYYTAPVGGPLVEWSIGHLITISEASSASAGGFVFGVGGIVIAEIILNAFRLRREELRREGSDDQA
ncbi:MAG: hypothetical protein DI528_12810 [Shinella sp.]|nr:MAG: hypothetical protein DI528_12810 [Shinella sp.]